MLDKKRTSKKVPIIYSTSFLSFSSDNKVANGLTSRRLGSEENRETLLILNPLKEEDEDKILKTNACLKEISFFHEENEILFFPFSSFEIENVEEYSAVISITLNHSLRFKKKVENCGYFNENGCLII